MEHLELVLGEHLVDRRLELIVRDVGHLGAREDVADESVERLGVRVRELRERVDTKRLDEHRRLELLPALAPRLELALLVLDELPAGAQDGLERAQAPVVVLLLGQQLL